MSNDSPVLTSLTESSTEVPVPVGWVENYVLLLVLLCVFAGGTLVLLSLLLLFCHRCCRGGRRYSRASDDPEKTNTTYVEDSQPTQEITTRLDESDAVSAASCQDGETERFASTCSTGRRVSFNESALYEQERSTQDKGRRYTLTEGDFHHLKKARLTHLHLAPVPPALKILTIMECESAESSTTNINETPAPKLPLTIYQLPERRMSSRVLDWMSQSASGGLPGDPHHSIIMDRLHGQASSALKTQHSCSVRAGASVDRADSPSERAMRGEREVSPAPGQTSVLQFFSKLRRHASLEGAGPYFKKWKFDSSHRAASLDAKGSPRRKPFQRQRAASETTDHTEDDVSPLREDTEPFPASPVRASGLQSLSAESLSHSVSPPSHTAFFSRLQVEAMVEVRGSEVTSPVEDTLSGQRPEQSTDGGTSTVKAGTNCEWRTVAAPEGAWPQPAAGQEDVQEDDLFQPEAEAKVRVNRREDLLAEAPSGGGREDGLEEALGARARARADSGSSLAMVLRQEGCEGGPSLYRDIWSLRASLEQYASSDQSSTDRESVRSDADSSSSLGGGRSALHSCLSQDLDDDAEGEGEAGGAGGEGEAGGRKLLQMDSGYASIEAPSRAPEELRLFGTPGGGSRGKTASERRLFFTSSGRKGSVCESFEAKLFQEELEDETACGREKPTARCLAPPEPSLEPLPEPAQPLPQPLPRPHLRRRDYSIDEKTDALFSEFLRHDPRFDQQNSPLRPRHRSRVHLRKQWQRHKQYSDPGAGAGGRYSPSLERQRFTPLRRGDSAGYPLDTRYHSTLSRIASAADEEANEGAACEGASGGGVEGEGAPRDGVAGETREGSAASSSSSSSSSSTSDDDDEGVTKAASGCTESANVSQERDVAFMDPRIDNRNNNSSQAIPPEVNFSHSHSPSKSPACPRLSPDPVLQAPGDKLGPSLEERLYTEWRITEKRLGQKGTESLVTVSHTASPGHSPV